MAQWGNKDSKSASGTITGTTAGAITGVGTAFTTEAKVGNTLRYASTDYQIVNIADDTHCTVIAGTNNGNGAVTAIPSGSGYTLSEKPAFVSHESGNSNNSSGSASKVFGVDVTEEAQTEAKAKGIAHAGWVRYYTYTDSEGNVRNKSEVLVAGGSITGDQADDTFLPDGTITIGTQPSSISGAAASFTGTFGVVATVSPAASLAYQWQVSTDGGTTFNNVTNGGVYSGATTATLTLTSAAKATYNNYKFRCVVSANGDTPVTSAAATLVYA